MKKILLLIVAFFSATNSKSQTIINEGFETTGFPYTNWISSGFISSTTPCIGTKSIAAGFNTSNPTHSFQTPNYSSTGGAYSVQISYRNMTFANGNVDFTLFYRVNDGPQNTITTWTTPGNMSSCTSISGLIPSGAVPNGSNIRFGVTGTRVNINSDATTVIFDNLFVTQILAPVISNISHSPQSTTSANITYTINPGFGSATSVINYGLSPSNLNQSVTGFSASNITTNTVPITGLTLGTQYYYQISVTNQHSTVQSSIQTFTTFSATPTINWVSHSSFFNSISVCYGLSSASTSVIKYGTDPLNLNLTATGHANNSSNQIITLTGLTFNTTYYYRIEATNDLVTTQSSVYSISTPTSPGGVYAYYPFNNSRADSNGLNNFGTPSGSIFVADRNGNANSALRLANFGTAATITGLPYGTAVSSIVFWVKFNSLDPNFNFVYHYGTASSGNGVFMTPSSVVHFSSGSNHSAAATHAVDTWYHYAIVFNGTQSKIYRNGVLLSVVNRSWNVVNNANQFKIGLTESGSNYYFNGEIDDLIIFNDEITASQVSNIYNLSVDDISQRGSKFTLYPNPTNDRIFISGESAIRRAEVYSVLGQSLIATKENEISMEHLPQGIYFIKIEDEEGQLSTHKVVKK